MQRIPIRLYIIAINPTEVNKNFKFFKQLFTLFISKEKHLCETGTHHYFSISALTSLKHLTI